MKLDAEKLISSIEKMEGRDDKFRLSPGQMNVLYREFWGVEEAIDGLTALLIHHYNRADDLEEKLQEQDGLIRELREKNMQAQIKISVLEERCQIAETALRNISGHQVQKALVQAGKKIRYKSEVSCERVQDLLEAGKSVTDIANEFGVSRGVIYRRMDELKKRKIEL